MPLRRLLDDQLKGFLQGFDMHYLHTLTQLVVGEGQAYVDDGSRKALVSVPATTINVTGGGLSADTWYYVFVNGNPVEPAGGQSRLSFSSSVPVKDPARGGWYDPLNRRQRAIGAFLAKSTTGVVSFKSARGRWEFQESLPGALLIDEVEIVADIAIPTFVTIDWYAIKHVPQGAHSAEAFVQLAADPLAAGYDPGAVRLLLRSFFGGFTGNFPNSVLTINVGEIFASGKVLIPFDLAMKSEVSIQSFEAVPPATVGATWSVFPQVFFWDELMAPRGAVAFWSEAGGIV